MRDAITDLHHLALDLGSRPTRLGEVVPDLPVALGTADASGAGMGGVWLSADPHFRPLVWRATFPSHVQTDLVSTSNPRGKINNSDLELAGQIAHLDVLNHHNDCRERTVCTLTDNISARSWQRKAPKQPWVPPLTYSAFKPSTSNTTATSTSQTTSRDRLTQAPF